MTRLFLFLLMTNVLALAHSQEIKHFKPDLSEYEGNYDALIEEIQEKRYVINDTTFEVLDNAAAHYRSNKDRCSLSHVYAVKAVMYFIKGVHDSAEFNFINSDKTIQPECSDFNQYYLYFYWGKLQFFMNENQHADSLYNTALQYAINLEDKTYELNILNNLGNLYSDEGDYRRAINTLKEVNELANKYNIHDHKLLSLQNLGAYMIDIKKYDSSLYYLSSLEQLMKDSSSYYDIYLEIDLFNNMALIYEKQNKTELAAEYYLKAIDLGKENNISKPLLNPLKNYTLLNESLGDFENANKYLWNYLDLKDSLFNEEKYEILKSLETQYQTAKQREMILQQNLELERRNRHRNTLLFIVAAMLLILIAVVGRLRYIRRSKSIVEREKKRSDELLLNILPEEVADELKNTGTAEARDFDDVTVLFTDFKNFTSISQEFSAKELVAEMNACFKRFDEIIQEENIEKIKTIGDAYMAAGGLNYKEETGPDNVIRAAIKMRDFLKNRFEERNAKNLPAFEMRVGIHTGPVVAGIVGVKKFQYDIWGDTVNTASRMETNGEVGKVNISEITYKLVKENPDFTFKHRGNVPAKGKGEMSMHFVEMNK